MTTRHTKLVVNPTARKGEALALAEPVSDILRSHGWTVEKLITTDAEHAVAIARNTEADEALLVALGGDGLVARVAEGAHHSGALVAPLSAGRGHDFIRAIGAPSDVLEAARLLPSAREFCVDLGFAGDTPFLGVATAGYDSRANDYANAAPHFVPSALVYAYGGARALFDTKVASITTRIDGTSRTFSGWNVAVGNSGRYGAGMRINPDADLHDGKLDITTNESLPRWRYPFLLPKLFAGTHVDGTHIRADRGAEIEVSAPAGWRVYADGDIVGETPMTFTVVRDALRILASVDNATD